MALFCVFIVVPMLGAIALSLFRWNGLGTPHWAGAANWIQFARDPLARQALTVTAKVVVLSWVLQTPISIALGLFTAGRQRYRSVYAALYVLPLLLSTAGIALMWEALLDPNFGGLTALSRSSGAGFPAPELARQPVDHPLRDHRADRLAVHPVPHPALPDGPPADPRRALRGGAAGRGQPGPDVLAGDAPAAALHDRHVEHADHRRIADLLRHRLHHDERRPRLHHARAVARHVPGGVPAERVRLRERAGRGPRRGRRGPRARPGQVQRLRAPWPASRKERLERHGDRPPCSFRLPVAPAAPRPLPGGAAG